MEPIVFKDPVPGGYLSPSPWPDTHYTLATSSAPSRFFLKKEHMKLGEKTWWWVDKGAISEEMMVDLKTHYMHV